MIRTIDMDGDVFKNLKADMNLVINALLKKMNECDTPEAEVNVKMKIQLLTEATESGDVQTVPLFTHKVGYAVKLEGKKEGHVDDHYVLEREHGVYWLKEADDPQMSMFDAGDLPVDDMEIDM